MCLSCAFSHKKSVIGGVKGKEDLLKFFEYDLIKAGRVCLHTHDNKKIHLTKDQIEEICNNAIVIIPTGVDFTTDIWAIQWPNDYKLTTF